MQDYFRIYEPHLVRERKVNRLRRRRFWAAGVNDLWAVDQHDKWLHRFGLALHVGLEPFSGRLLWLKVWHNNHNSKLILSYYLETVEKLGCTSFLCVEPDQVLTLLLSYPNDHPE